MSSTSSHQNIISKWDVVIDSILGTSSSPTCSFPSILQISMQVAAQTIGLNLVSVQPMSGPSGKLSYIDYAFIGHEIYNSLFEKIDLSVLYKIEIKENLIQIEFNKEELNINFHDIKYIEEFENDSMYIYKISFNKCTTIEYANVCEYNILEKVECDWKTYMRDKKIDGILD